MHYIDRRRGGFVAAPGARAAGSEAGIDNFSARLPETAKALGIEVPPTLVARADEVIE